MDDYRSRLIDESMQLKERLTNLKAFLNGGVFNSLLRRDKVFLQEQYDVMKKDYDILEERLTRS